ncbi:MAG: hypothetical protein ABSH01_08210 [Terriglobia bacterium]
MPEKTYELEVAFSATVPVLVKGESKEDVKHRYRSGDAKLVPSILERWGDMYNIRRITVLDTLRELEES